MEFLSTLSLRRATLQAPPPRRPQRHFYPRSPCGERQRTQAGSRHNTAISIHALLAESDQQSRGSYIRTEKFLSTLSLRRATNPVVDVRRATGTAISIHALLAESDDFRRAIKRSISNFYPRSPCGERLKNSPALLGNSQFLSTLSLRRATTAFCMDCQKSTYFYPRSPCGERQGTLKQLASI